MREILAGELDTIDDERVFAIALTGVDVDNELEKAVVYFDADDADEALEALDEHSGRLRRAVSSQARLRKTPRLEFHLDEAVEGGGRIEDILANLDIPPESTEDG
jgi:ribosome-binding factor A